MRCNSARSDTCPAGWPVRILVAEDEDTLRCVIRQVLAADGHEVTEADSGEKALEIFRSDPFPLVITDILMKRMTGLDLLAEIKLIEPDCVVVVMTSHASLETATTALRAGAYDYLTKPFDDVDMISAVVNRAVDKIRLAEDNRQLLRDLKQKSGELEQLNESLREMANKDGLTGLYNHRYFREALDREIARANRHRRPFSIVLLDIDYFKRFNDTFGHLTGDEALKTVASLLRSECRATSIMARYGGEEFVILAAEAGKEAATLLAERMRGRVECASFAGRDRKPTERLTLSVGVSTYGEDGTDSTALIEEADRAMYRAKRSGRNKVCIAGPSPIPEAVPT